MNITSWRKQNLWMYSVFVAYCIILIITLLRHEPWNDEAQAWLLARDSSVYDLFVKHLRYEGSPGLWHLLLMIPAKMHWPFDTIKVISGSIAAFGIYVLLRYAPFPRYIKVILPFTHVFLYQYAVVCRAYVLFPALLFLLAAVFHDRFKRPYAFIGLLLLIASVSLHGMIISLGIYGAHLFDLMVHRRRLEKRSRIQQFIIAALFSVVIGFNLWVLRVPSDYYAHSYLHIPLQSLLPKTVFLLSEILISNIRFAGSINLYEGVLAIGSLLIWYLIFKLLWHVKTLKYFIIPGLGLSLLFSMGVVNPWHICVLFVLLIFVLWISIGESSLKDIDKMQQIAMMSLAFVLIFHLYWSYCSVKFDWVKPYSGGYQLACYIKNHHLENKRIYTRQLYTTSINAYFDRNIFSNTPDRRRAFMNWDLKEPYYKLGLNTLIAEQPDLLVIPSNTIWGDYRTNSLLNYRFVKLFNGGVYWRDRIYKKETFLLYIKYRPLDIDKIRRRDYIDGAAILDINDHLSYLKKSKI